MEAVYCPVLVSALRILPKYFCQGIDRRNAVEVQDTHPTAYGWKNDHFMNSTVLLSRIDTRSYRRKEMRLISE
jgi:hypothetical protein